MSELSILGNGLAFLAVRQDVIDCAVIKRMDFVYAKLAHVRLVPQLFTELEFEEPRFNDGTFNNGIDHRLKLRKPDLGLCGTTCAP